MKGKGAVKVFLIAVLVTYPVFVFLALMVFHLPISIISLGMMVIAIAYFGFFGSDGKHIGHNGPQNLLDKLGGLNE